MIDAPPTISTPGTIAVRLTCPSCKDSGTIDASLATRLTMIAGEQSKLAIQVRSVSLNHVCGQLTIEGALAEMNRASDDD